MFVLGTPVCHGLQSLRLTLIEGTSGQYVSVTCQNQMLASRWFAVYIRAGIAVTRSVVREAPGRTSPTNVAMSVYQLIQERISPPVTTALLRLHTLQPCGAPGTTTTVAVRPSTSPTTAAAASKLEKRAAAKVRRQADEKARRSQIEAEDAADQRLGELEQRVRRQVEERATRQGAQAARCEAEVEVSKAEERAAAAERRAGVAEARATRLQLQLNAMRRKVLQSAPDLRGRMRTRVRVSTRKYKSTNQRAHYARARARAHARARRAGTIRPRVAREQ